MVESSNFMVPTAHRPYTAVETMAGVGFKPMNTLEEQGIWSAVIRVEAGQTLPARHHTALCECLVVLGSGRYESGQSFASGDYLREENGVYEPLHAKDELVFFVTHHGVCRYVGTDESTQFVAEVESIQKMLEALPEQ